jgi:acetyltransferase
VDLVVIAVPAEMVPTAAREAVKKKAGAIVVVASGFKETGATGRALEAELTEICQKGGVRLLGPNCLGIINTAIRLNASFSKRIPQPGHLAIFSQSGALCTAMMDIADERELGVSKSISIGNKADITEVDVLSALAHDDETKVIVGYLEDISDGDKFVKAAEEASSRKPPPTIPACSPARIPPTVRHSSGPASVGPTPLKPCLIMPRPSLFSPPPRGIGC